MQGARTLSAAEPYGSSIASHAITRAGTGAPEFERTAPPAALTTSSRPGRQGMGGLPGGVRVYLGDAPERVCDGAPCLALGMVRHDNCGAWALGILVRWQAACTGILDHTQSHERTNCTMTTLLMPFCFSLQVRTMAARHCVPQQGYCRVLQLVQVNVPPLNGGAIKRMQRLQRLPHAGGTSHFKDARNLGPQ